MENRIRLVLILLVFVWMGVIFGFSSRPASLSAQDSYRVGKLFAELFVPNFKNWSADSQDKYIRSIDRPIRKTAHASEYAILAMLAGGVFLVQSALLKAGDHTGDDEQLSVEDNNSINGRFVPKVNKRRSVKSMVRPLMKGVAVSALFACTDEFHQRFVQGRAGSLVDVCIDTGGAVVGVIILGSAICLCGKLVKILRKNRQKFGDHSAPQDNC